MLMTSCLALALALVHLLVHPLLRLVLAPPCVSSHAEALPSQLLLDAAVAAGAQPHPLAILNPHPESSVDLWMQPADEQAGSAHQTRMYRKTYRS